MGCEVVETVSEFLHDGGTTPDLAELVDRPATPRDHLPVSPLDDLADQFADALAEWEDLTAAIGLLDVPEQYFADRYRARDDDRKDFEPILRAFIYQRVTGESDQGMQRMAERPKPVAWKFGLDGFVSRRTFAYTWENRLDDTGRHLIERAADRIRELARDHEAVDADQLADPPDEPDQDVDALQAVRTATSTISPASRS